MPSSPLPAPFPNKSGHQIVRSIGRACDGSLERFQAAEDADFAWREHHLADEKPYIGLPELAGSVKQFFNEEFAELLDDLGGHTPILRFDLALQRLDLDL